MGQQNVGRLSFIYAGEGQADDEGIPGDCQCGWLVIQACKLPFKSKYLPREKFNWSLNWTQTRIHDQYSNISFGK